MKFNFRKVSAVATSALMVGMTVGAAAAASFPEPFSNNTASGVAVVVGTGSGVDDSVAATSIANYLATKVKSDSGETTVVGGDSVLLAKSSDNLNLGDGTQDVFTGTIDDGDLSTLLADGTYVANDNDEFDYEQKISIGNLTLQHFRDSDYENLVGLDEKTPTVGFKISSNTWILNYTLDFTQDAESDVTSGDLEDIEGSDLILLGKKYYVSDLKNGSSTSVTGKLTLLDSAEIGTVSEGETVTVTSGGKTYEVSIAYIDADEVRFVVNGENAPSSGKLQVGQSYKLSDGAYIGVRDISKLEVSGETGSATFSIGSGKLEITSGSDIKLNDNTVNGVKAWVYKGTPSSGVEKIDKIVIEWKTDEEEFITPETELVMPGFEAVKLSMKELVRPDEEKVVVTYDGDDSIQLTVPIKDGTVDFNILYANSSGEFTGIGKASDERLATTSGSSLTFIEKDSSGNDYHAYFVASYNSSQEAQSYLLRAKVSQDTDNNRNETTIEKNVDGSWTTVCSEKTTGDTCDIGDVTLTISTIQYTSGGQESVELNLSNSATMSFNRIYTAGGLTIYLPYVGSNATTAVGAIDLDEGGQAGHSFDTYYLYMTGEDKDDTLGSGTTFSFTIDDNSDGDLQVSQINTTGGGAGSGTGGINGLEIDETNTFEAYVIDDVAPRILHYTNGDQDYAEVYYPSGESETYAELYLSEVSATISSSGVEAGSLIFKDSEKASWQDRDVILVGGSCINSATAEALGVAPGTCGAAFTEATGVGSGQYLIQSVGDAFTQGKIALVVAGYEKEDTAAAASRLVNQPGTIDTSAGKKYLGVVGVTGTSTITEVTE